MPQSGSQSPSLSQLTNLTNEMLTLITSSRLLQSSKLPSVDILRVLPELETDPPPNVAFLQHSRTVRSCWRRRVDIIVDWPPNSVDVKYADDVDHFT